MPKLAAGNADGDRFALSDGGGDAGESALGRLGAIAPGIAAFRPEQPGTGMRLELAGHRKTIGARRAGDGSAHDNPPLAFNW